MLTDCDGITNGCKVGQIILPDGTMHKEFTRSSGWQKGLPVLFETWGNNEAQPPVSIKQRWSTILWTQDITGVSYMFNPRVTETNIYDPAGNRKRSSVNYTPYAISCGTGCTTTVNLPMETKEYAANATDVLRTTKTFYYLPSHYTNRRIIGLPSQRLVCDAADCEHPVSKVDFLYDDSGEFLIQQGAPIRHDTTNYGASFVAGRGNLTKTRRWNVSNNSEYVESTTGYNTTGSPIFSRDPLNHQTTVSYTDSFADVGNANTYAYPTTVTDPDNNSSRTQYSYNVGVVMQQTGPQLNAQTPGAVMTYSYDLIGRLYQATNAVNGAYTYIVYPTSSNVIQTYTTIQDGQPATVSAKLLDGAGRVRATAAEHPGSTGGYVGQYFVYDPMGRQVQQTNPTEIYGSWIPAGDDAAGWAWSVQSYDWKGRPRVSTNQDGTTKETTYGGCGCAGGEIITVRDEMGRRQRLTHDELGRLSKTQILNWDQTVYSTRANAFNALDQIISVTEQQGTSGASQVTLMSYDGHGRLATRKAPAETATTSYTYNIDDTVLTITDGRGATRTNSYNSRHLIASITYFAPTGVSATPNVTFNYDGAGNRTQMIDGIGQVDYHYDRLSRLTSETRSISSLSRSYTTTYGYNLASDVSSITDPFNAQVNYGHDRKGRLTSVTGTGFAGVLNYATSLKYRAWDALKSLDYGPQAPVMVNQSLNLSYNSRLMVSRFEITGAVTREYQFNSGGQLSFADNIGGDAKFDRTYGYDQAGRLSHATAGPSGPYDQTFTYDVWGNTTARTSAHWSNSYSYTATYQNDRNTDWQYDAVGNLKTMVTANGPLQTVTRQYVFDAESRTTSMTSNTGDNLLQYFDGDGLLVKTLEYGYARYFLHSTVLGGRTTTLLLPNGDRAKGYVYAGGQVLAQQIIGDGGQVPDHVAWNQRDPAGTVEWGGGLVELDPLGADVGLEDPYTLNPDFTGPESGGYLLTGSYGNPTNPQGGCTLNGIRADCSFAMEMEFEGGAVRVGRDGMMRVSYDPSGHAFFEYFTAYADGHRGYMPSDARYVGNGNTETPWQAELNGFLRNHNQAPQYGGLPSSPNALLPQDTKVDPQSAGGSLGNPFKSLTPFQSKLNACTKQLFGVELGSFTRSRRGHDGTFTGYGADAYSAGGSDTQITVVNEVNSYTSNQLAAMSGLPPNSGVMGLTGSTASGYTPYRNFTASGLTNSRAILATQIHELGNSLRRITGVTMDPNSPAGLGGDTDPGTRLERCVFGGEIDSHGHLHHF